MTVQLNGMEQLAVINRVIEANPGTKYTFPAATLEEQHARSQRYARMVALETLRQMGSRCVGLCIGDPAASSPEQATLTEMRLRDKDAAPTWFKLPALGACGRAFIDRRALLGVVDELLLRLIRINGVNDNPAQFSKAVDELSTVPRAEIERLANRPAPVTLAPLWSGDPPGSEVIP